MKKLVALAGLLVAFGLVGCFGEEIDEPCVGAACEDEATLNLQDPAGTIEEEGDPAAAPAMFDRPTIYTYNVHADTVVPMEPADYDFNKPTVQNDDAITPEQLTPSEIVKIDTLRGAIGIGLDLGKERYLETVSLALANLGVLNDYEGVVSDGFGDLAVEPEACPFAKYYDNGFQPSGASCQYLVDIAKVEVYSELSKALDNQPLPGQYQDSEHFEEAVFWYEQGAISGVEEQRVLVRTDLKQRQICNKTPTPVESSYDKGIIVGRQLMAKKLNDWLSSKGHKADYPTMSQPIQVCNADQNLLLPSKQAAVNVIEVKAVETPLCGDYEPPTQEGILQYSQAKIDYEKGIKEGVDSEFALAAVKIFKVIPCNVSDPIVVDLDGDGLELLPIPRGVNFDLYGVGADQAVSWVAPDDGLLVFDRNNNQKIDDGAELFGNLTADYNDGFEHLAELDRHEFGGNLDGVLDSNDAAFQYLAVWQDANTDGVSSPSELISLASLKITSIKLQASDSDLVSGGNRIPKISFMTSGENRITVGDAYLTSAPYARLAKK